LDTENISWNKVKHILEQKEKGTARKPHFLKRGKHIPATPKRVVYFDSESRVDSNTLKHQPYIICATFKNYEKGSQRKFRYGSDLARENDPGLLPLEEFWDEIVRFTKLKDLTWVMAHNCGYDLLATGGAKRIFERGFVPLGHPYEKGLTFIWEAAIPNPEPRFCGECTAKAQCPKCKKKRKYIRNIRFVSTSNYYVMSLERLGKTFGIKKLNQDNETKFDFGRIEEYPIETVIEYCERDVDIIINAMEALFYACENGERTGFGSFKNTLPAMSFNAYRTWFMPNNEIYCHDNNEVIKLEREAYYGGRVEVWKRGHAREKVFGVDINSMYPFVMRNHTYPAKLFSHRKRESVDGLDSLLKQGFGVIAKVTIKTNENAYPLRYKGKLIFPVGTFHTTISTPEIRYALDRGHILTVHEVAVYTMAPIFRTFVDRFYAFREKAKQEKDRVWDLLYKLVLNSLYGKFGQLKREWQEVGECNKEVVETEEVIDVSSGQPVRLRFRKFGGKIYLEEIIEDVAYNSSIAIASHVTAYARMLLWNYIQTAGVENHYYNDTDSLYVNATGLENLRKAGALHDTQLGKLALEKTPESAAFYGPKHYQLGKDRVLKGISSDAKQLGDRVFEMLQWPSFKSAMNSGNLDSFANRKIIKTLSPEYAKGWVLKSGEVKPLQFRIEHEENILLPWEETEFITLGQLEEEANAEKPRKAFSF
jgi:hypothetical protein